MKKFWRKIVFQIKRVPWYGWVAGLVMILLDMAFYAAATPIIKAWSYKWAISPIIHGLDDAIPFCCYFWIEIYIFSFLFWIFGPIVASISRKDRFLNYMFGLLASYVICFFIFIFAPTFIDREAIGLVDGDTYGPLINNIHNGLSKFCMKCMLFFDGGKTGWNLFPSMHCLISLFCYLGICRNKDISLGSRIYAIILAILIAISTLFVKQHYLIDVLAGWVVAVGCWFLMSSIIKPGERLVKKHPNLFIIKQKPNRNLQQKKK